MSTPRTAKRSFRPYPRIIRRPYAFLTIVALLLYIGHLKLSAPNPTHVLSGPPTLDRTNWSGSAGAPGASMYQPPPPGGTRIAVATMSTKETNYDHISLSGKMGKGAVLEHAHRAEH